MNYKEKYNNSKKLYYQYKATNETITLQTNGTISKQYRRLLTKHNIVEDTSLDLLQSKFTKEFILYGMTNIFNHLNIFKNYILINDKNYILRQFSENYKVYKLNNFLELTEVSKLDIVYETITSSTRLSLNLVTNINQAFQNYMNNIDIFEKLISENEICRKFLSYFINSESKTYSSLSKILMTFIFLEKYKMFIEIITTGEIPNLFTDEFILVFQYFSLLTFSEYSNLNNFIKFEAGKRIDNESFAKELTAFVKDCKEFDTYIMNRYIKYAPDNFEKHELTSINFINMYYIYILRENNNVPNNVFSQMYSLINTPKNLEESELDKFISLEDFYDNGYRFDTETFKQLIKKKKVIDVITTDEKMTLDDFVQIKQRHVCIMEYDISFSNCFECSIHNILNYLYLKNPSATLCSMNEKFREFYVSNKNKINDDDEQATEMTKLLTNIDDISYCKNKIGICYDMNPTLTNLNTLMNHIFTPKGTYDKHNTYHNTYDNILKSIYKDINIKEDKNVFIFDNKYKLILHPLHAEFRIISSVLTHISSSEYSKIDNTIWLISINYLRNPDQFKYIVSLFENKFFDITSFEPDTIIEILNSYKKFNIRINDDLLCLLETKTINDIYLPLEKLDIKVIKYIVYNKNNLNPFIDMIKSNKDLLIKFLTKSSDKEKSILREKYLEEKFSIDIKDIIILRILCNYLKISIVKT